jgi:hypothetical protein
MINLASRPFQNERLPATLFAAAVAATLLLTLAHVGVGVWLVRGGGPADVVRQREAELAALRREVASLRVAAPPAGAVARWRTLQDLVDRRMFSWSLLFAQLEESMPRQVKLLAVSPTVAKGDVALRISAVADPPDEGLAFIERLETEGPFAQVFPRSVNQYDQGGARYEYELRYRRPALMMAPAPPAPSPWASPSPSEAAP